MICFCWAGFPQYAARLIGQFVGKVDEEVVVVANRPAVPVEGMERYAKCRIIWTNKNMQDSLKDLLGQWPRVLFVNGWFTPLYNKFRDEVRANGGRVFAMVDNNFTGTWKDYLRAVRFRLLLRNKYDGYLVPGKNGVRMMQRYGAGRKPVAPGMYSADDELFCDQVPILQRPKRILFVGRFVALKNLSSVCTAFLKAKGPEQGWELELRGAGPEKGALPTHPAIKIKDFVQPEALSDVYMGARAFVLASHYDHWGLVVHEAALSGCVLLLSNQVGAADDFVTEGINGYLFSPWQEHEIVRAMEHMMELSDIQMVAAESESVRLAHANAGKDRFYEGVLKLIG